MKRSSKLIVAATAAAILLIPAAAIGSHQYTDVPDSNIFHSDIDWLADNGVTAGCNPPANDEFCPTDAVTRQQMAAFMKRLATSKIVDAATALVANDADMLDGMDSDDFLGVADTAADSDLLEGMTSDDLKIRTFAGSGATGTIGPNGTPGEVLALTFEVPVAGSILVTHSTSVSYSGNDTAYAMAPTLSEVCDTQGSSALAYGSVETDHSYDSAAGTFAFQVDAGSHTVRLCGEYSNGTLSVVRAQLGVVFEPGGAAAAPVGIPDRIGSFSD